MNRWVAIALGVVLWTAGSAGAWQTAPPSYGGSLTVGVDLQFRGFDPLKVGYLQVGDRSVVMAVEERLFDMDRAGKLIPELALAITPSEDGRSYLVKLRQGVTFHDGTPFDADAVVEHWQRFLSPKEAVPAALYVEPVESVTRIDPYTVSFTLKHPWPAFKTMLASAQWAGAYIPSPKAMRAGTQNRAPVGTGPFVFKEWERGERLVVVRNPNYWRKGRPYLDQVVFRPVSDAEARFKALKSGKSDVIITDQSAEILKAQQDRSLSVYSAPASGPYTFIVNTASAPLDDPRVRRALAHAWNQEEYLKERWHGLLPVARDPFGGSLSCSDGSYRGYDPGRARTLLAEYGRPVTLELLTSDTVPGREAGETMQRLLKEVGVALKLTLLPEAQLVKRVMSGEYQLSGWRLMELNDLGPYFSVSLHSKGKLNFSRYENRTMDELLAAQQTETNETARRGELCAVAGLINADAVYLYAGGREFHLITRKEIQGLTAVDQGVLRTADAWLKPAQKQESERPSRTRQPAKKRAAASRKRLTADR